METAVSVDAAVNNLVRMILRQLENTTSLVEKQIPLIAQAINYDVDQNDLLIEQIDSLNNKVSNLQLKATSNSEASKQEIEDKAKEVSQLKRKLADATLLAGKIPGLNAEIKKLNSFNPERLNKKNKELRKSNEDKTKTISELNGKYRNTKNSLEQCEQNLADLKLDNTVMLEEIKKHRKRDEYNDGEVLNKVYVGKSGLQCFINVFNWGLTYQAETLTVEMINDLDWHVEVRTNAGLGVIISVTSWLTAFYPHAVNEITENWPSDLHEALSVLIVERCQHTHPHLTDRVDWAKDVLLADISGIAEKHLTALNQSGFDTLYSIMSIPVQRLPSLVRGMGDKTCRALLCVCNEEVTKWEIDNWTFEERKIQ